MYEVLLIPCGLIIVAAMCVVNICSSRGNNKNEELAIPRIMLWCHPRSRSTAFERVIMQIPNGKVYHEQFRLAFYYGKERISSLKKGDNRDDMNDVFECAKNFYNGIKDGTLEKQHQIEYSDFTFNQVTTKLLDQKDNHKTCAFVFCKAMSKYVTKHRICDVDIVDDNSKANYNNYNNDGDVDYADNDYYYKYLLKYQLNYPKVYHTFLIRNPVDTLVSYYKMAIKLNFDLNTFDINSIGLNDSLLIYNQCVELGFEKLIIIDSDDLSMYPQLMFKKYCTIVGLPYDDSIISFNNVDSSNLTKHFETSAKWHEKALKSNGFNRSPNCKQMTISQIKQMEQEKMKFIHQIEQQICKQRQEKIKQGFEKNKKSYQILWQQRLLPL